MIEIKIYKTTWKALKLFALTIPFIVIGVWVITRVESSMTDKIMGWFGVIFFGLGIPIGFFHLFDRRPQIIINENGIWDRTTNQDEIKWEQIKDAYPLNIYGQKFISLKIDKSFKFRKKQYKWALRLTKEVGGQELNLHLGQVSINSNKLLSFIHEMIRTDKENRKLIIDKFFNN